MKFYKKKNKKKALIARTEQGGAPHGFGARTNPILHTLD